MRLPPPPRNSDASPQDKLPRHRNTVDPRNLYGSLWRLGRSTGEGEVAVGLAEKRVMRGAHVQPHMAAAYRAQTTPVHRF